MTPSGPHGVGTVECELTDDSRLAHLGATHAGRRLRLKLWYPAERATHLREEPLWESLRTAPALPLTLRVLLRTLRVPSASLPGARGIAPMSGATILYNHGLISFAG